MSDLDALEGVPELAPDSPADGVEGIWCERWSTCLFTITITI